MFAEVLREKLRGIADLSPQEIAVLEGHYRLMVRWNSKLNLTKITALEESVERHYVESLFLGRHLPDGALRIVDIGSGAGFPGLPVAVLRPDCDVTLIESHQRKAVFLREASREVKNIRVVSKRAEDVREVFDVAISRAVSYSDLESPRRALAPAFALLTGGDAPPAGWKCELREPVPVPNGISRWLRSGTWRVR